MKLKQGSSISGYVKIRVIGEHPEHFLNRCAENEILIWEVSKSSLNQCEAKIHLSDISRIRHLRVGTNYKIRFINKYGLPFWITKVLSRRPLLIGLILSIILLITISNMVWQVTITGVPEELEKKISSKLNSYGVHPGALKMSIESPNQIQQLLVNDIPELLWVGVEQKGTIYRLEGVEKIILEEEVEKGPRHLIANKNAVITSMYVKRGQPKVKINEYVEKGKILVSGEIEKMVADDEDENNAYEIIAAEGEVWATTWYTVNVEVPLKIDHEELTGNVKQSYQLKHNKFSLPLWPWRSEGFSNQVIDTEEKQLKILHFELPIYFVKEKKLESTLTLEERTKEEAIDIAILQAKTDLLRELGKDVRILSDKVLHETIESGKVKLSLYITIEENIALEYPINQGD